MTHWKPADIALYDQLMAATATELDTLDTALRGLIAKRGEKQAAADLCALLITRAAPELAALLTTALLRDARTLPARNTPDNPRTGRAGT
jgi:hypothetical protein